MSGPFQIRAEGLTVRFETESGPRTVLKDVSLRVEPGHVLAVLGVNGSGKSTLVSALSGLSTRFAGIAGIQTLDEQSVANHPCVAFLHQDYRQTHLPWLSVLDNVTYSLRFRGVGKRERDERGRRALDAVLPEVDARRRVHELSGGQLQLLAVARALASDVDAILADEPLSAADSVRAIRTVITVARTLRQRTVPTLWVSHNLDEALLIGDRIGLLSRRLQTFETVLDNPIQGARTVTDLSSPELTDLRARMLAFLVNESAGEAPQPLQSGVESVYG